MRASFSDPQGRPLWRALRFAPTALLVVMCITLAALGVEAWGWMLGAAALSFAGATLLPSVQRKRRAAELECGPGYVDVKDAGTRTQRIHAKSIDGATTARTSRGYLLTLSHTGRSAPLSIEVDKTSDVDEIRHALGIGHGGVGTIGWRTTRNGRAKAGAFGLALLLACGLTIALVAVTSGGAAASTAAAALMQFMLVGGTLSVVGWLNRMQTPSVVMAADAIGLQTTRGWFRLPYDQLIDIRVEPRRLVFVVPPPFHEVAVERRQPWGGDGLSDEDAAALVAQLKTAAARARGFGPQKNDVTGRVEVLRRNGESPRDWLVRLDMAGQMLATGTGYRGNTLDTEDLWTILEDPEADAELRAAAARVLRHSGKPDTKIRIDAAVAAVRDDATNKKLRIAVQDDLDGASQELSALDAQERPVGLPGQQRSMGVRW
jgi:hypothetical protein